MSRRRPIRPDNVVIVGVPLTKWKIWLRVYVTIANVGLVARLLPGYGP